jgi:isopenicillin-N N-acyltransferase like protein
MRKNIVLLLLFAFAIPLCAFAAPANYMTRVMQDGKTIPIAVVSGSPYEMGQALGEMTRESAKGLLTRFITACQADDPKMYANALLDAGWKTLVPHMDPRFIDEMRGFSAGSGIPLEKLTRAFMVPVVSPYSCSSVVAWDTATANGHVYQTRNLDWSMGLRPHDFPLIVVYRPDEGLPHVNVTFAGYLGSYTGINKNGIAMASMGDAPGSEYPYDLEGEYCGTLFRRLLYDAQDLNQAISMVESTKHIKKYHYVISDGQKVKAGVKMKAHAPDLVIWKDNDPTDEYAPKVMKDVVYNDEGRGVFPLVEKRYGKITAQDMIDFACAIPIRGANIYDVVFDATTLEMWFSFAQEGVEAYKREFAYLDLKEYLK